MAKATHTDYQKFQYFFLDSKWDIQAIKRTRLEIIQKQRTTALTVLYSQRCESSVCTKKKSFHLHNKRVVMSLE